MIEFLERNTEDWKNILKQIDFTYNKKLCKEKNKHYKKTCKQCMCVYLD